MVITVAGWGAPCPAIEIKRNLLIEALTYLRFGRERPEIERSNGGLIDVIRRRDRRDDLAPRSRWEPLWSDPMTLLSDMDRIFDDFRTDWETLFVAPRAGQGTLIRQPLVDIADDGESYVVKAEVPGIKKDELSIEVTENAIEISGEASSEREEEDKETGVVRRERHFARFQRSLPFPERIVPDEVDAQLNDGVLTVRVPKAAPPEKKAKKVEVK